LQLEHYDAAQANPALAAMLLGKLRNGAMGAAGLGIPDPAARDAWVAANTGQAERARSWTVTRIEAPGAKTPAGRARTFSISADGNAGIPQRLEGREEKMGNGTPGFTITDLFPGETVVFPLADLDPAARRAVAVCLPAGAR
jgi:hypothetical protein